MTTVSSLVTTQWLDEQMKSPDWKTKFRLLDGTWDLPRSKRNFVEEHKACRIPGARYFSLDDCRNKESSLPNTVPELPFFEEYVSNLGITNDHHVVIYDNSEKFGLYSAPRVWWLFNLFGHENVSVVNGGLPKLKLDGFKTVSGEYTDSENWEAASSKFKATFNSELIRDVSFMKANLENGTPTQIIDGRNSGRFNGTEPEPNPKIPSGHIPDSFSMPHNTNYDPDTKTMMLAEGIKENFKKRNVDIDKPVVSMCGSAMSACSLALAVNVATGKKIPVFDDAWTGWQASTPDDLQVREGK